MMADAETRINEIQKSSATDSHRTTQITRNKFHETPLKHLQTRTPALTLRFNRRIDLSQSHGDAEIDENEIGHSSVSQCLCEKPNRLIQFGERQVRRTPALR